MFDLDKDIGIKINSPPNTLLEAYSSVVPNDDISPPHLGKNLDSKSTINRATNKHVDINPHRDGVDDGTKQVEDDESDKDNDNDDGT